MLGKAFNIAGETEGFNFGIALGGFVRDGQGVLEAHDCADIT
jgi:hypothetical protein